MIGKMKEELKNRPGRKTLQVSRENALLGTRCWNDLLNTLLRTCRPNYASTAQAPTLTPASLVQKELAGLVINIEGDVKTAIGEPPEDRSMDDHEFTLAKIAGEASEQSEASKCGATGEE